MCTGNDHINLLCSESIINDLVPSLQGVSHAEDVVPKLARAPRQTWGPFLESPEIFSHPTSRSKIVNFLTTELCYSYILIMNRSSLHARSFKRKHLRAFERRAPGLECILAGYFERNSPRFRSRYPRQTIIKNHKIVA